jgi:hypothetical protein
MSKQDQNLENKEKILDLRYYLISTFLFLAGIVIMLLTSDSKFEFVKFLGKLGSFMSAIVAVHFLHEKLVKDEDRKYIISAVENVVQSGINNAQLKTVLYENYKDVNWRDLILESKEEIIIHVHYCDDWLDDNQEHFVEFLNKNNSKVTVFLPDYNDENLMEKLIVLYPDLNREVIRHRIINTINTLSQLNTDLIKVFLTPHYYSYSRHSFDSIYLISLVEMYRVNSRFMSPVIRIQINDYKKTKDFFDKEINGLLEKSKSLNWIEYKHGSDPNFHIEIIDLTFQEGKEKFNKIKKDFLGLMSRMYGDRYYGDKRVIKKLHDEQYCLFLMYEDSKCNKLIGCSYVSKNGKFSGLALEKKYHGMKLAHKLIMKSFETIPHQFIEVRYNNVKLRKLLDNCGFTYVDSIDSIKNKLKVSNEHQLFKEYRVDESEGKFIYTKTKYRNPKILSGDILMMQAIKK